MEGYCYSPTTHVNNRIRINSNKHKFHDILEEYNLKRNIFNPKTPSPNMFITKLERRMMVYYNSLYNSVNRRNTNNSK